MKEIKIKYHTDVEKVEKIEKGDWIDLRAAEDVFVPLNSMKLVSLGVSMQLPEGYEAHLAPRSSTFKKWGVIQVNSVGVIDESYCGNDDVWKIPLFCLVPKSEKTFESSEGGVHKMQGTLIKKGDRICQFRIMKKQEEVVFKEVDDMENESRGGFGSTGHK